MVDERNKDVEMVDEKDEGIEMFNIQVCRFYVQVGLLGEKK